jgi:hypothetical protein
LGFVKAALRERMNHLIFLLKCYFLWLNRETGSHEIKNIFLKIVDERKRKKEFVPYQRKGGIKNFLFLADLKEMA